MSTHKTGKYRNLEQSFGLLHLNKAKSETSNTGFVSEYLDSGSKKYAGLVYHTDGQLYGFKGLTEDPFAQDSVNVSGAGFATAPLKIGSVDAASNMSALSGYVQAGQVRMSANKIESMDEDGALSLLPNGAGSLYLGGATNHTYVERTPTAATDVANKSYVDSVAQGLTAKQECRVRTTADLTSLVNYSGALETRMLTSKANGAIADDAASFDGVSLVLGDRVLVMMQLAPRYNGIYYVSAVGGASDPWTLTRALDFNQNVDVTNGAYTFVNAGAVWGCTGWVLTSANPVTLETSALTFVQFSQIGVLTGKQLDEEADFQIFRDKIGDELNFRSLAVSNTLDDNTTDILEGTQSETGITFNLDSKKITQVGALTVGSIASGFGTIVTDNDITTSTNMKADTYITANDMMNISDSTIQFYDQNSGNNQIIVPVEQEQGLIIGDGDAYLSINTATYSIDMGVELKFNYQEWTNKYPIISFPDNTQAGLTVSSGAQEFLIFDSTTGAQKLEVKVNSMFGEEAQFNKDVRLKGGFCQDVDVLSSAFTLDDSQSILDVEAGASDLAITLPAAAAHVGRHYFVRKSDSGAGAVVITPASGESIDGLVDETLRLEGQGDRSHIVSHGAAGWYIY